MIGPDGWGASFESHFKTPFEEMLKRTPMTKKPRKKYPMPNPLKKAVKPLKTRIAHDIIVVGFELFHAKERLTKARQDVVNAEGDVNFLWLKAAKLRERWDALKRKKVAKKTARR
jgi:hypothetical protein